MYIYIDDLYEEDARGKQDGRIRETRKRGEEEGAIHSTGAIVKEREREREREKDPLVDGRMAPPVVGIKRSIRSQPTY